MAFSWNLKKFQFSSSLIIDCVYIKEVLQQLSASNRVFFKFIGNSKGKAWENDVFTIKNCYYIRESSSIQIWLTNDERRRIIKEIKIN